MPTLIFRCPITGYRVQGWVADDVPADPPQQLYVSLRCSACAQAHLVNPATGEVLGSGSRTNA
jgi:hypothetical protein